MKKFKKISLIILVQITILALTSKNGNAQGFSLTTSLGVSNYLGDLSTEGNTTAYKPDFSVGASYDLLNRLRLRLNLSALSVQGDDANSTKNGIKVRNLNFKTQIQEAALLAEFDILDNSFNSVIPYIFAGPSVYHFDPHPLKPLSKYGDVSLHSLGTEGQLIPGSEFSDKKYNLTQFNIQMGVGIRFELSEKVSLGFEASYRSLFTDYLDDVSSNKYITPSKWKTAYDNAVLANNLSLANTLKEAQDYAWGNRLDPKTGIFLTQTDAGSTIPRGNPSKNDAYYSYQVRLNINLSSIDGGSGYYSPRNPNGRKQLRCARVY